jgi:cytochrome c-type biogenesis protein CcmE
MTPRRKKRLAMILLLVVGIGSATGLALNAFRKNLLFFFSPSQVVAGEAPTDHVFRVGGLVVDGSVRRQEDGLTVYFDVTDTVETIPVVYTGSLPDLFREGQGIVAMGRLDKNGAFMAEEVLAKHDETYMPPEVAEAIETAQDSLVYPEH